MDWLRADRATMRHIGITNAHQWLVVNEDIGAPTSRESGWEVAGVAGAYVSAAVGGLQVKTLSVKAWSRRRDLAHSCFRIVLADSVKCICIATNGDRAANSVGSR